MVGGGRWLEDGYSLVVSLRRGVEDVGVELQLGGDRAVLRPCTLMVVYTVWCLQAWHRSPSLPPAQDGPHPSTPPSGRLPACRTLSRR